MDAIKLKLIAVLLPIILGPIIAAAVQASKKISPWLDKQHAAIKQAYVALWAIVLPALVTLLGVNICAGGAATCEVWGVDWKLTISTFAMALVTHGLKKKPKER